MNTNKSTKISQSGWVFLALCGIVLSMSAEVVGAQAAGMFTLRNRNESKTRTSLARMRAAAHSDVRRHVVEEVIDLYTLDQYKLTIYAIAALKERSYSDFNKKDNISYVSSYLCQCLLRLAEEHLDSNEYQEAKAAYNKVEKMLAQNHKDQNFYLLTPTPQEVKLKLERYEKQRDKEHQNLLASYGLQLHQKKILAMRGLRDNKKYFLPPKKRELLVLFYACKYCFDLSLEYYNKGMFPQAQLVYEKACVLLNNNNNIKAFQVFYALKAQMKNFLAEKGILLDKDNKAKNSS